MKDEKGRPMTYWGGLEPTDPYEKGFIDGMQKQMQSSVDRWVNATTPQYKELSLEEIENAWFSTAKFRPAYLHYLHFATAILQKASEK